VFRLPFLHRPAPLQGAPTTRRLRTYSAQSGYVYQYFYEGHREFREASDAGTQFVFRVSADNKTWIASAVLVSEEAIRAWESAHERTLSATERYAVAKMALFQAFDERETPPLMKAAVRVRAADVDAIVETLGL